MKKRSAKWNVSFLIVLVIASLLMKKNIKKKVFSDFAF